MLAFSSCLDDSCKGIKIKVVFNAVAISGPSTDEGAGISRISNTAAHNFLGLFCMKQNMKQSSQQS